MMSNIDNLKDLSTTITSVANRMLEVKCSKQGKYESIGIAIRTLRIARGYTQE